MPGKKGKRIPKQGKKVVCMLDPAVVMNRMHQLKITQDKLAEKLTEHLRNLNIRTQFGKPIEYEASQISRIINREREIKLHEFLIISKILQIPPQDLLMEKFGFFFENNQFT